MRLFAPLLVFLIAPLEVAHAQPPARDVRAFVALRASPAGALTPLLTPAMLNRQLTGVQLGIRYGLLDEDGVRTHAVAGSVILMSGFESDVTLTAGVRDADCANCTPALLLGLAGDMRVLEIGDIVGSASTLNVTVSGDLGYAQLKPGDDYAITLGIGAPITLSLKSSGESGLRLAPYFTPVFGIGQTSEDCIQVTPPRPCHKSGTRWVLAGGLGVWKPMSSVSASIGVNQVVFSGAKPVFGVNVVVGGR
jgi:hypothetical protein